MRFSYRVYDKEEKQYSDAAFSIDQFGTCYIQDEDGYWEEIDEERYVVEHCTGLKDKNGKEIYEGDIVKFENRNYEVVFDNYGQFCLENRSYHWLENGYSFNSVSIWDKNQIRVEVIGNIHENPELVEEK